MTPTGSSPDIPAVSTPDAAPELPTDVPSDLPADIAADIAALRDSTERLVDRIADLRDEDVLGASRLPGWSRGHVLTHLARNADAMVNLVTWAVTGVETPMYASRERRDSDIDAGAARPVDGIRADVRTSAERLDAAVLRLTGGAAHAALRTGSGAALTGRDIPYSRMREIEIHSVDLDLGYSPTEWPPGFTARTLDVLAPLFRTERETPVSALADQSTGRRWEVGADGPVLHGELAALLAWLTGRSDGADLRAEPPGLVPPAPRWV